MVPDIKVPSIIFDAHWATMNTHIGYSQPYRSPYMQGILGRLSTIFWSYPGDFIRWEKQGIQEGWRQGTKNHEWGQFARFVGMLGFQATVVAGAASLGMDVSNIWGLGMMPVKMMSMPWEILYGSYKGLDPLQYVNKPQYSEPEREKALSGVASGLATVFVPQFRFGKKLYKNIVDMESGYKETTAGGIVTNEVSTLQGLLNIAGFPRSGPKETWDLMAQMTQDTYKYNKAKKALKDEAVEAIQDGNIGKVEDVRTKATQKGISLTYSEIYKAKNDKETLTVLKQRLKTVPKALRAQYQQQIDEIEAKTFPSGVPSVTNTRGSRGMWSNQASTE